MKNLSREQIAAYIQFTQIDPRATKDQITTHIELCKKYAFNAAMIAPCWVPLAKQILSGTSVKTATFIDFGMGNLDKSGKAKLIRNLREQGADEIDYAPNMGYFLSKMYDEFYDEAKELVRAAEKMPLKGMLQLGMIDEIDEKKRAIRLLEDAGVAWIKNSSGGWPPGATNATVEDIRLIKSALSGRSRIKASGGINTFATAIDLIKAGAELLGTSRGLEIIDAEEIADSSQKEPDKTY